jgi:hypothetical protein
MATGQATRNENNAAAADSSTPVTMDEIAATALLASPSIARHATSPRASSLSPAGRVRAGDGRQSFGFAPNLWRMSLLQGSIPLE